ncbi:MAG: DEAD/DEAH box helicase [Bryobacteraceae bacterium]
MYLQKHLAKYLHGQIRHRGELLFKSGAVTRITGNQWTARASVAGTTQYDVELTRSGDAIEVFCDCPYFESEGPCKHIWAAVLEADRKNFLLGSVGGGSPALVDPLSMDDEPTTRVWDDDEDEDEEPFVPPSPGYFKPHAGKKQPMPAWRSALHELNSGAASRPRAEEWRAGSEIYYLLDPAKPNYFEGLRLQIMFRERMKTGGWGKLKALRGSIALVSSIPDAQDREILTSLAGAPDPSYHYTSQTMASVRYLQHAAAEILLPKICATGRCRLSIAEDQPIEAAPLLEWDAGVPWLFRLQIEKEAKTWAIRGGLYRGEERMELGEPAGLLETGILIARNKVARVDYGGFYHWVATLRKDRQIRARLSEGNALVAEILKMPRVPSIEWPEELRVEEVRSEPRPLVRFGQPMSRWDKNKLSAELLFDYGGEVILFQGHSDGLYQPEQKRYLRRDQVVEQAAIDKLSSAGLKSVAPSYGMNAPRWEVAVKKLPGAVRQLVQAGWHVEAEGKAFRKHSDYRTELTSGVDWFELHGAVDYGDGAHVKLPELLKALERGEQMVSLGDGSYGIVPEDFLQKYGLLAKLGRTQGDHVRFSASQAGLLDTLLAARPEIKVDEVFARAREELRQFDGIRPAPQPEHFVGELRDYQREGLAWMYFLQKLGFGGCLADDMGVGKTPQVLAMLDARRELRIKNPAMGASLVVVPRSLVYNWAQEAARFTPKLRVLDHTGAMREKGAGSFQDYDLVLATYGTLRRDTMHIQEYRFDYIILDEAQAIKNASSESAKVVRLLQANHRLVLSGTPIENHLGELWSLFEFLNPGMLGAISLFQGTGGMMRNPDEDSRRVLSKALRPFILRRTKAQVAKELPEKLEQTIHCELDGTQRKLYDELREHYRQALLGRIETEGLAKSKIQILEALLRLRQAACHPGLIDKKRVNESSAKLEALIPQLEEVMEGGHKAIVFSQFTSFLAILRQRLDKQKIVYEYLDGSTTNRQAHVERFQQDSGVKLFLISLKAGGVGLNLTAAEYVFLLDPWWNPAVEAQAIDRAHRIGQLRRVFAYRLIARDTVEEKVLELQKSKRALAEAIIGEDNRLVGNLKREDLELLLS